MTSSAASRPRSIAVWRRQHTRIGGEEIAPGRQHVAASARRRAGRSGRNPPAVERGEQRGALGRGARLPGRIVAVRGRHAAVDVQAVLDGEVLEIAQPGVDAGAAPRRAPASASTPASRARPLRCAVSTISPARRSRRRRSSPSACAYSSTSRSRSRGIAGQARCDQRRRQMPDGHRGDPALGLRGLARIADDEGIDHGQRPDHRLREAGRRERDRLAGQPFQRAVRAHVHERIGLCDVAQPQRRRRPAHGAAAVLDRDSRRAARRCGRGRAATRR